MADILLLNGPNLNLLGRREPSIYGSQTLDEINAKLCVIAESHGVRLRCVQSNAEHELIDEIHATLNVLTTGTAEKKSIIINPGAFTHTSVALRDALLGVAHPFYEVHISNVHQRESFRARSYLSDVAAGVICGLGVRGYEVALLSAIHRMKSE